MTTWNFQVRTKMANWRSADESSCTFLQFLATRGRFNLFIFGPLEGASIYFFIFYIYFLANRGRFNLFFIYFLTNRGHFNLFVVYF
jgi:hypothetical protein